MSSWSILQGDCVEQMRTLDDDSIDAVVCDPPYGIGFMGHEWDQPGAARAIRRKEADPNFTERRGDHTKTRQRSASMHAGEYDLSLTANRRYQGWCELWAAECLRVLKPGGHLLASCGTRTVHRMTAGIEDAGFEIRDTILWLYGSGFPKSLDVSKAIDKRRDDEADVREVCRFLRAAIEAAGETAKSIAARFDFHPRMVEHWAARDSDSQPSLPTLEQWDELRGMLGFDDSMDAEVLRLNLRKGEPGEAWADRPITGEVEEWKDRANFALTNADGLRRDEPASAEAREWQGWGTALKPAHEPIVVARKPLIGTVAANVLEHGTGALNIDACRIDGPKAGGSGTPPLQFAGTNSRPFHETAEPIGADFDTSQGRWPANVVLSHTEDCGEECASGCPVAALDAQTGELKSGFMAAGTERAGLGYRGRLGTRVRHDTHGDSGGASRFFYCAKTSRAERNAGLDDRFAAKALNWSSGEESPGTFQAEGTDRSARNHHPTVKPISLMRWLVRLVTPPGGTVLDPFTGSGSTGCAAVLEGFDFIGCEREAKYVAIAEARIAFWAQHVGREVEEVLGVVGASTRESRRHEEAGQESLDVGAIA